LRTFDQPFYPGISDIGRYDAASLAARPPGRACETLLRQTGLPIAEVAVSCGFADQSHFTNTFSKITRTTPMGWRRMGRAGRPSVQRLAQGWLPQSG